METADSTQLIKCRVTNREKNESFRLIERSNFDLWRYLVVNKHHIAVSHSSLCLWVSQGEYHAKEEIYCRAGLVEAACRLTLLAFDENEHDYSSSRRYTLEPDVPTIESILISHIPVATRDKGDYTIDREFGYAITTDPVASRRPLAAIGRT